MIKALIFDFGRVISSQKPLSLFRSYENDLGLAPESLNQIMFSRPLWREALLGRRTAKEFWHSIGPELGLKSHEEIDEFRRRYHSDESINNDVLNLILQLHNRYKLAVLSNSPPGLDRWLADWSIIELFVRSIFVNDGVILDWFRNLNISILSLLDLLNESKCLASLASGIFRISIPKT